VFTKGLLCSSKAGNASVAVVVDKGALSQVIH
jgi:hypothetical protein